LIASNSFPLIDVKGVSFSYGKARVLQDITLSINRGDFLAIIGPNGSGKTTLIKIILGLLKPEKGLVRIMGKLVEEFQDWSRIGYVPQKATNIDPLFPASVREVIAMGLLSKKGLPRLRKGEAEALIDRALSQVDMDGFKNSRIGQLSGGQQQRIFIARAIVNKPHILFLDEPTTGVDAETQGRFYDMLSCLNQNEGITIVLITHEVSILNRHITQVACLNQRLIYHGSHQEFCNSEALREMLAGGHHLLLHRH